MLKMQAVTHTKARSFPNQLQKRETISDYEGYEGDRIRLPRIHNRTFSFFHALNVSPSINHFAVPICRARHAALWLMEGLGGESHFRSSPRNGLPVVERVSKSRINDIGWGCDKRLIRSTPVLGTSQENGEWFDAQLRVSYIPE